MTNDFLTALRVKAESVNSKIQTALNTTKSKAIDPHLVNSAGADSAALLDMIDTEISRPLNAAELEAQLADTSARPGETKEQTAYRLKAQAHDNRLAPPKA